MASYDFKTKDQLLAGVAIAGTDITAIKQGVAEDVRFTMNQVAAWTLSQGRDNTKQAVRAVTIATLPANTYAAGVITATANGALPAQDGITLIATNRLLVMNEGGVSPANSPPGNLKNGIYVVTQVGTGALPFILTRDTDMDIWAEVVSALVPVSEGTTQADSYWYLPADSGGVLGTTTIAVQKFVGSNVYQPYNAKLSGFVLPVWLANTFAYFTGATTVAIASVTAFGRALLAATGRTSRGDAIYTILATDVNVSLTTVLTAPRIWTLPAASAFAAGQRVTFIDEVAGVSATNTLTISAAGADTIDGVASYVLATPSEVLILISDGVSKWFSIRQGVNTQRFVGSGGTWNNLPRGKNVRVRAIGPGGGGGGGPKVAAATSCSGGGSGAGGMDMEAWFNPANLASTVTVTVPTGGLGGAGATVLGAGADGALASADASFGIHLIAYKGGAGSGGAAARVSAGGAGTMPQAAGNSAAGAVGGTAGGVGATPGGAGIAGATNNLPHCSGAGSGSSALGVAAVGGYAMDGPGGGGAGGGFDAANLQNNGGGTPPWQGAVAGGGVAPGGAGTPNTGTNVRGRGGSGGASNVAGVGGAGADGVSGGGGGGGGASQSGNGGAGGAGSAGEIVITTYF